MKTTIEILGKGGDGTQTLANIVGEAALLENKNVVIYPIYDAAVRGGTSNARVIISNERIINPVTEKFDVIIDLYSENEKLKIADEFKKNKKLLGMFFLGAVISKLLRKESLMTAIKNNVLEEYYLQNIKAFEAGVTAGTIKK